MNTPKESHLECIKSIINSWGQFQGMVAQGCAGATSKEKATWLPTAIFEWLWHPKNSDAGAYELEDVLDDILNFDFNLQIADDSVIQICNKIVDARVLCLQGRLDEAKQNYCNASPVVPSFIRENAGSSSEDEDDDDDEDVEMEEPPQLVSAADKSQNKKDTIPKVDEDGWETVSSRKTKQK